jgi:hypothetical protein
MYRPEDWLPLTARSVRARVNKTIEPYVQDASTNVRATRLKCLTLPFYEGALLIRVENTQWAKGQYLYLISTPDDAHVLNGTSPPIHALNAALPIKLTAKNVVAYNRFFGFFVRGEEGPFYIFTGRDDTHWPKTLPEDVQRDLEARIERCAKEPTPTSENIFKLEAVLQYGRHLFEARYEIDSSGRIEMEGDDPLPFDAASQIFAPLKASRVPAGRSGRRHEQTTKKPKQDTTSTADAPAPPPKHDNSETCPEDPTKKPAKASVESAREKNLEGMRQAAMTFGELANARSARDFFYHWPLSIEGRKTQSKLPPTVVAQVRRAMEAILEHAAGQPTVTAGNVRILKSPSALEGMKAAEKARFEKLAEPVGFRMSPPPEDFCRDIRQAAPHMGSLINQIAAYLRLSHRIGDGRVKLPPLLLVGPPSSGKSWAIKKICEVLNLPTTAINGGGASDNRFLAGTARGWATATVSAPVELLIRADIANPAMVIEEIDKCGGSDRNGNMHHSLLTLLEPINSREWMDEYVGAPVDLSHINWFATANELWPIPGPLLNRFTVIQVNRPTCEEVIGMIDSIAGDILASFGSIQSDAALLSEAERATLIRNIDANQWGFRDLRRAILEMLGNPPPNLQLVG